MIMLTKQKARHALARQKEAQITVRPYGVGGIDGNSPCVSVAVGSYELHFTLEEWNATVIRMEYLVKDAK